MLQSENDYTKSNRLVGENFGVRIPYSQTHAKAGRLALRISYASSINTSCLRAGTRMADRESRETAVVALQSVCQTCGGQHEATAHSKTSPRTRFECIPVIYMRSKMHDSSGWGHRTYTYKFARRRSVLPRIERVCNISSNIFRRRRLTLRKCSR